MARAKKTPTPTPTVPSEPVPEPDITTPVEAVEPTTTAPKNSSPIKPGTPTIVRSGKPSAKRRLPLWVWIAVGLVVVASVTVAGYLYMSKPAEVVNSNQDLNLNNAAIDDLAPRLVDGVLVPPTKTNPNLFAVMIENASDSRPPSGLDKASVVYEALAEGGITRFMAIIPVGEAAPEIGPVRSARPYFLDWASEYNKPLYVHAGGSPQALDVLRLGKVTVVDFNQFTHGVYFWRDKNRRAPHNLYSSSDKLYLGIKQSSPDLVPNFTGWSFTDDPGIDARPETVKDITIDFSSLSYRVVYAYDRGTNLYNRSVGNQPHVTRDGTRITAKNVIVQFVKTSLYPKETQRLKMDTVGDGKALIFKNGQTIVGTWKKTAETNRTMFYDETGAAVSLSRGTTWIDVIPTDRSVTY